MKIIGFKMYLSLDPGSKWHKNLLKMYLKNTLIGRH